MNQRRRGFRPPRQRILLNKNIQVPELRVIGEDGHQYGVLQTSEALQIAQSKDLDLLVIVPTQQPPVAKILDYGRHKFEKDKQDRETKKKSKAQSLQKEVKMRPSIGEHDYQVKLRKILEALASNSKVRVVAEMRGRQQQHPELAQNLLKKVLADIDGHGRSERRPALKREGRAFTLMLGPLLTEK